VEREFGLFGLGGMFPWAFEDVVGRRPKRRARAGKAVRRRRKRERANRRRGRG